MLTRHKIKLPYLNDLAAVKTAIIDFFNRLNAPGAIYITQGNINATPIGNETADTAQFTNVGVGGQAFSTTTGLATKAGTTSASSLRIPHGAAPTSPVDGDMWTTTAGLYIRINGVTVGPLS